MNNFRKIPEKTVPDYCGCCMYLKPCIDRSTNIAIVLYYNIFHICDKFERRKTREQILNELDFRAHPITTEDEMICASYLHFCPQLEFIAIDSDSPYFKDCRCYEGI